MLIDRLNEDVKTAMKARDTLRLNVLRMTLSEIKNARIEKLADLTDEEVIQVIRRGLKRRQESIEMFGKGGREDLVAKETQEAEILTGYLPQAVTGEVLAQAVDAAIAETGAAGPKDLGKVMKAVMARFPGQVDGKEVQTLVRARLGA